MAQKIIRSDGTEAKAEAPAKAAEKKPAEVKKKTQNVVEAKPVKGSATGYRVGAWVLWVLAIVCEVFAIMALLKNFVIRFTANGNTNMMITMIIFIVLDLIFAVIAAQLWKKANHIDPPSEKNKFVFYLVSELGVIMACVCFLPLIILLLTNKKIDKKSKLIVAIVAIAALLITGFASADYNPISAEEKAEAEQTFTGDVYWTPFGHKYHIDLDCNAIVNSSTVYQGSVTEAIESGRTSICSFCAHRHEGEFDFDKLNVEPALEELPSGE
ncbi:MAG: hypothetical protein J5854_00050 [Clostridia bacterium]|nr:hypothetical protein [Clostridia bacterium]